MTVDRGSQPMIRGVLAGLLRGWADRLDPPQVTVRLAADDAAFQQSMRDAEQTLRRATQARVRRQPQWPEPPPPQPPMHLTATADREAWVRAEKRSPS